LGIAFVDCTSSYFPLLNIKTPNTKITLNFGEDKFVFEYGVSGAMEAIYQDYQNLKDKMNADKDMIIQQQEEELASIAEARKEQAVMLQSFVGFPIKYCVLALQRNSDNIEQAAEWAMLNFDTVSNEHPELFVDQDDSSTTDNNNKEEEDVFIEEEEEDIISNTTSTSEGTIEYNIGYAYSLPIQNTGSGTTTASKNSKQLSTSELQVGQQVTIIRQSSASHGREWIEEMYQTIAKIGIIKAIDTLQNQVLVEFYFDEDCTKKHYWYSIRSLSLPEMERVRLTPELQLTSVQQTSDKLLLNETSMYQIVLCKVLLQVVDRYDKFQVETLGGLTNLFKLLEIVSYEHLTTVTNIQNINSNKYLVALKAKLTQFLNTNLNFVDSLLQEGLRLLKESSKFNIVSAHLEGIKVTNIFRR
jgi:hypothetical protein